MPVPNRRRVPVHFASPVPVPADSHVQPRLLVSADNIRVPRKHGNVADFVGVCLADKKFRRAHVGAQDVEKRGRQPLVLFCNGSVADFSCRGCAEPGFDDHLPRFFVEDWVLRAENRELAIRRKFPVPVRVDFFLNVRVPSFFLGSVRETVGLGKFCRLWSAVVLEELGDFVDGCGLRAVELLQIGQKSLPLLDLGRSDVLRNLAGAGGKERIGGAGRSGLVEKRLQKILQILGNEARRHQKNR
mmetsp:Transcript_8000/g.19222  ORF Transcript_8000/g.19222 Transcript_8000/m.19222 type:complete len:244 (-) Transcript_8000:76-807(-)